VCDDPWHRPVKLPKPSSERKNRSAGPQAGAAGVVSAGRGRKLDKGRTSAKAAMEGGAAMKTRAEKIVARLGSVPKIYRGTYRKAVEGKSLRAAINAQCLECVCWQREEVRLCTDSGCPLFAVRPYQDSPQQGHQGPESGVESSNDPESVSEATIEQEGER
jgi:hypothetical protein